MPFTTTRIDYENSQAIRTPMDTVVMVGDVTRFHTPYNGFSLVSGNNIRRSDGMIFNVNTSTTWNQMIFLRGLNLNQYSSEETTAAKFLTTDNAWGPTIDGNGICKQTIKFRLNAPSTYPEEYEWFSIVFSKREGPVTCKLTALGSTRTVSLGKNDSLNYYMSFPESGWTNGSLVTLEITAVNPGQNFYCAAAGPGVMAMFTPETLISMDASLKTVLDPDASSLPASTIDISAVFPESFKNVIRDLPYNSTVTLWQGYENARTVDGTTYAAEMVNRTFYYTKDDSMETRKSELHLQARDTITALENKTTGAAILARNGEIRVLDGDPILNQLYYGGVNNLYSTRCLAKGRYGFLMGMMYKAARCAGDYFYIDCADISEYITENNNPSSMQEGPYDYRWDWENYEDYNEYGNTDRVPPEYKYLGYIPNLAPRPLIAWMMNVYRMSSAKVKTQSGTVNKPFAPCYVDAGKPKITIAKGENVLTIREENVADLQEEYHTQHQYVSYNVGYVRAKGGVLSEEGLDKIGETTIRNQMGTYNVTYLCGDEPVTRILRKTTREVDGEDGTTTTEATEYSEDYENLKTAAGAVTSGWYEYIYKPDSITTYWSQGVIRVNTKKAFNASLSLGNTSRTMHYEWFAERLDKQPTEKTIQLGNNLDGETLRIEYQSYMKPARIGSWSSETDGMTFTRDPRSGSFTFRGDPRLQPHDVFYFRRINTQIMTCTIESLDIHYELGGTTETVKYRGGNI